MIAFLDTMSYQNFDYCRTTQTPPGGYECYTTYVTHYTDTCPTIIPSNTMDRGYTFHAYFPEQIKPPKHWRWFDVFRTHKQIIQQRRKIVSERRIMRRQERFPIMQRVSRKRRAYVQALVT